MLTRSPNFPLDVKYQTQVLFSLCVGIFLDPDVGSYILFTEVWHMLFVLPLGYKSLHVPVGRGLGSADSGLLMLTGPYQGIWCWEQLEKEAGDQWQADPSDANSQRAC